MFLNQPNIEKTFVNKRTFACPPHPIEPANSKNDNQDVILVKLYKHIHAYVLNILQYFTRRGSSVDNLSVSYRRPRPAIVFVKFSFSTDSSRTMVQLLSKELALTTGKLSPGGIPRTAYLTVPT